MPDDTLRDALEPGEAALESDRELAVELVADPALDEEDRVLAFDDDEDPEVEDIDLDSLVAMEGGD